MTPTTYSFDFSIASNRPQVSLCVFTLLYNGVQIAEHASLQAANDAADKLAFMFRTARECFTVERVWL